MAQVSPAGIALIRRFEGLRLEAYRDAAGIWTVGYGHTGPDVHEGMVITPAEAERLLAVDLQRFEAAVERSVVRPATQGQFDAMVSLCYNIGPNAFQQSTVLRRFNAGNDHGAAEAFILWVRARGTILEGLVRRRAAEIVRFLT